MRAFNAGHPFVQAVNATPEVWDRQWGSNGYLQRAPREILASPTASAAWILWFVRAWYIDGVVEDHTFADDDLWTRVCDEEPELVACAWDLAWSAHRQPPESLLDLNTEPIDGTNLAAFAYSPEGLGYEEIIPYKLFVEQCGSTDAKWILEEEW
jgi:hypothetical protein